MPGFVARKCNRFLYSDPHVLYNVCRLVLRHGRYCGAAGAALAASLKTRPVALHRSRKTVTVCSATISSAASSVCKWRSWVGREP